MKPAALRGLEARLVQRAHGFAVELGCPFGLIDPGTTLDARSWACAQLFDGERDTERIAAMAGERLGESIPVADVTGLAQRLAQLGLCDDAGFAARLEQACARPASVRSFDAAQCGAGDDALEWRIQVAGLVANDWDMPAVPRLRAAWTPAADPRRASHLYSRTYAALRHVAPCARILALGWCAARLDAALSSSARVYATPLGDLTIDPAALACLPPGAARDELAHAGSSSLARQASFLRVVQRATPWLPVLVSLPRGIEPDAMRGHRDVEAALDALARVLELPGETLILCAADLSQRITLAREAEPASERPADVEAVDAALELRADEFFALAGRRDRQRAFAPYLMLRLLERFHPTVRGSTLGYRQLATGTERTSAASVVFQP